MENRKHTSLKDLAQALGVSIPTVSRALKDSPEISRELCAKAKALAKEPAEKCATYHWSGSPGYCHSFLCINSEWNREYGYCQRVFRDYHDLA